MGMIYLFVYGIPSHPRPGTNKQLHYWLNVPLACISQFLESIITEILVWPDSYIAYI